MMRNFVKIWGGGEDDKFGLNLLHGVNSFLVFNLGIQNKSCGGKTHMHIPGFCDIANDLSLLSCHEKKRKENEKK